MISSWQNFNFRAVYQNGVAWLGTHFRQASSKLPAVKVFIRTQTYNAFNTGKAFFWAHKSYLIGGAVVGVAALIVRYIRKNRPQLPDVTMETTLNVAQLCIKVPKEEKRVINVTLTFCIDTSGSMDTDERKGAVKRALATVLGNMEKVVAGPDGAEICIAVVGFSNSAKIITPITKVAFSAQAVKDQIAGLTCNGRTEILAGLELAAQQLQQMAQSNAQASHTVVLLTDGDATVDARSLAAIHAALASTSATLFAIGVGKDHKKQTLEQIAPASGKGFCGRYIDATSGGRAIEDAIATIYQQAIASFRELELTTSQLGAGAWSANNRDSEAAQTGRSICKLGAVSENEPRKVSIRIHPDRLKTPLDLSTFCFDLAFVDPRGRQGRISLPWNPNTVINPRIFSTAPV